VDIISYGRYTRWDKDSRSLPELVELTTEIIAEVDVEFGMMVEIQHGKGWFLDYIINHPPFKDKNGEVAPSFEGAYQVKANPYRFFLGDTIWEPVEDKRGIWEFIIKINRQEVASKRLYLV
jgi:hypothetical protein